MKQIIKSKQYKTAVEAKTKVTLMKYKQELNQRKEKKKLKMSNSVVPEIGEKNMEEILNE